MSTPLDHQSVLKALGINVGHAAKLQKKTTESYFVLTTKAGKTSALPAYETELTNLQPLKSLLTSSSAHPEANYSSINSKQPWAVVTAPEVKILRQQLQAYLLGQTDDLAENKEAIEKYLLPLKITVFTTENLYIKAGEVYEIEGNGHDLAMLVVNNLTLEQGGQIITSVPAVINVSDTFSKINPSH